MGGRQPPVRGMTDCFLTLHEVRDRTKLSAATIYRWMRKGRFPRQVPLAPQTVRWRESDIDLWMEDPAAWSAQPKMKAA